MICLSAIIVAHIRVGIGTDLNIFRKGWLIKMQKIDMTKIEEEIEIEEGQQILPSKGVTKNVLFIGILLILGALACIAIMIFYPAAVLGLPLIAIVAYFIVRRR